MATTEDNLRDTWEGIRRLYRAIAEIWMENDLDVKDFGSDKKILNPRTSEAFLAKVEERYWKVSGYEPGQAHDELYPFHPMYVTYLWVEFRKRTSASKKKTAIESEATMPEGFPLMFDYVLTEKEQALIKESPRGYKGQLKHFASKGFTPEEVKKLIPTKTWD